MALVLAIFAAAGCGGMEQPAASTPPAATPGSPAAPTGEITVSAYAAGEALFQGNCAQCHGEKAAGSDLGPPLVHQVYYPDHHPDFSFQAAVKKGVRSHHWYFGDMPPVPNLTEEQVVNIICYVRTLQQNSGMPFAVSC